jgi:hypothetical protein
MWLHAQSFDEKAAIPWRGVPGAAFVRVVDAQSQPMAERSTVDGITSPNGAVWNYANLGEVKGCDWITSVGDRQLVAGLIGDICRFHGWVLE